MQAVRGMKSYCHDEDIVAVDDVNGKALNLKEVMKARKKELEYFKKMGVYVRVPLRRCWELTGKPPIGTRWVDHDKGNFNYRSRLVAKEYNKGK